MRLDVVWWDLDVAGPGLDALRADLSAEAVAAWAAVPGLRLKLWLADPDGCRWGAVMLWDPDRPEPDRLPPNRAARLIGPVPAHRLQFDVEAAVGTGDR